jgi:hypothetical protein
MVYCGLCSDRFPVPSLHGIEANCAYWQCPVRSALLLLWSPWQFHAVAHPKAPPRSLPCMPFIIAFSGVFYSDAIKIKTVLKAL